MEREARRGTRNFRKLSLPLGKKQKVSGNKYLGDPRASIFPAPREGATQKEREVKPLQSLQRTEPDTDQEKPVVGLKLAYIDPQVQSPAPHKPGMVENACNPNTQKVEVGGSEVQQNHPQLPKELEGHPKLRRTLFCFFFKPYVGKLGGSHTL